MNIKQLAAELEIDEGRRPRIYTDTVGKISGGVGRNLTDRGFSEDEIDLMRNNDIDLVCDQLDRMLPWWRQMSDRRMRVLANMTFNMGINTMLTFKNTLAAMQTGRYGDAAKGMLDSLWSRQVGARALRLAAMMREG